MNNKPHTRCNDHQKVVTYHNIKYFGSREEDEVSGFFVLSHLWMRGYFRLG